MAFIKYVSEDQAEGKLFEIYDEIQRNRGRVSNILRVQSLEPKAMRAHLDLYMATCFSKGGLSRKEVEILAVAVSQLNADPYGKTHHGEALARHSTDEAWLGQARDDITKAKLTEREHALVGFAQALTRNPGAGVKPKVEAMKKAGLTDREILQATQVTGYFNYANRITIGLGVELEPDGERDYHY